MRRFRFRLERVLRYRRMLQEARQRDFAEAQTRVVAQERYIADLEGERTAEREAFRRTRLAAGTRRTVQLIRAYLAALELRLASARKDRAELSREAEVRREALVRARRDVRALELLREKQREAWRRGEEIEEQKNIDEMAAAAGRARGGKARASRVSRKGA